MEPNDYIVVKIDGEYAYLKNIETGDELFISLYLLPEGTDINTKLHYEMFQYTII